VFHALEQSLQKMSGRDRYCCLMFDEMSIRENLHFNRSLTAFSTKEEMIVQYLKEVLDACQNAGLKVVATVCDMGANNVKALKLLGAFRRKPSMGIKSWIFLKDGKPPFLHPPPSQNGWLIDITAAQHVWRTLKDLGFEYLHTQNLNQDPLENTFGAIRLNCGSNNNPTGGQFVDALKTSIINGLALQNWGKLIVRMMVLLFWIIYNRF
ncbi:hypothetical protein B7P43_G18200, partial [Cryptotermes secundus]